MMGNPTVSINLCCYNSEKYLRDTLDSIVNQTYRDWELIIINDGSSDSTEEIIQGYIGQGHQINYVYRENKGLSYSRNEALQRSNGKYIAFIDHDDVWVTGKLSKQVALLENDQDIDFLYSNFYMVEEGRNRKYLAYKKINPSGDVFKTFLSRYSVGISTVMLRKKCFDRLDEFFDLGLKLAEEYDVFMRILYNSNAYYIDEPLTLYRIHDNMLSLSYVENYPDEIEYVAKKLKQLDKSDNCTKEFKDHEIHLKYMRAKIKMQKGDLKTAREHISRCIFYNHKHLLLYCFSYLPRVVWLLLRPVWQKGIFR